MLIKANDPRITWQGTVSLQQLGDSVKPWRLLYEEIDFFDPALVPLAATSSGVRICFKSDTASLKINFSHTVNHVNGLNKNKEEFELPHCQIETFIDGEKFDLTDVADDAEFLALDNLPPGLKLFEIRLPSNCTVTLHSLEIDDASVFEPFEDDRPRWVHYGSSISHCIRAESPSQTWPAIAARELNLNLTSLGYAGQCKLDPMVALMIRDLPAELITLKLGINTYHIDLSPRSFPQAAIGMIKIIREKQPTTPIVICAPIWSPPRETTPGIAGQTLEQIRQDLVRIVETFRKHGDRNIYYIDGLKLCGPEMLEYLPDELHPEAEGTKIVGRNFIRELKALNILEKLK